VFDVLVTGCERPAPPPFSSHWTLGVGDWNPGVDDWIPRVTDWTPGVHDWIPGCHAWPPGCHAWIPGCHTWTPGGHTWTPGCHAWIPGGHTWIPGGHTWTPGCHAWIPGGHTWIPGGHTWTPGCQAWIPASKRQPGARGRGLQLFHSHPPSLSARCGGRRDGETPGAGPSVFNLRTNTWGRAFGFQSSDRTRATPLARLSLRATVQFRAPCLTPSPPTSASS
jgi:hypothetical protein